MAGEQGVARAIAGGLLPSNKDMFFGALIIVSVYFFVDNTLSERACV